MAVIYIFDPHLTCLGAFEAAALVHSEEAYEAKVEFKTSLSLTSGYCFGFMCIDGKFRIFEIDEIDYRDATEDLYAVGTDLAVRELTDIVVTDVRCVSMTAPVALEHLLEQTDAPWSVTAAITTDSLSTRHYYKPLWSAIVSLMERYNVRMIPYFIIDSTGEIIDRVIDIESINPVYRGRLFESGDEASTVTVTVTGNPKTALYGRGKGVETGETESGDASYGPRLTFKDVVWSTLNGDPVNKPYGQEWVGDPDALTAFGRNGDHRYGVVIFEDITNAEELLRATWNYLQTVCWPTVSATATIYDLEMAEGYSWAAVRVNDEIVIRPRLFPADVTAKIIKIDRDYVNPANTRLEISTTGVGVSASSLYTETATRLSEVQDIASNVITRDSVIDTMVTRIMSSGTNMFTDPDSGALCFVSADGTSAMMLTGGGWMIADEKIGNVWQWKTAATGEGIVADQITAGTLQASLVKILGSEHFYWDASNIYIKEWSPIEMTMGGVTLTKTDGTFLTTYFPSTNIINGYTNVDMWTSYEGPPEGSTITFECTSATGEFYIWVTDNWDNYNVRHQVIMGPSTLKQTVTLTGRSFSGYINPMGQTIIGIKAYVLIEDTTDVGVTYDLGDITIPATETPQSGTLKAGCTLGKYTLHVTSVTNDTNVKINRVGLETTEETLTGLVTHGDYTVDFSSTEPFDLMYNRAISTRQIRIGCYDGTHYGIGFSEDGGVTWKTAINFDGVRMVATEGDYIRLQNSSFQARAGSSVSIMSGGSFYCYAGSVATFQTDDFLVKNREGRNLLSVSSVEGREGQIVLGEEGFPVNFAGGFILPVVNGGTGYNFGQVHRITSAPSSTLGANGDLAILYASGSGAYSSFTPTFVESMSRADSHVERYGMLRDWNLYDSQQNLWNVGNNNSYAYALYGSFTTPANTAITGDITLNMTGYHYYNNAANLQAFICDSNNILASGPFIFPYRQTETISCTIHGVNLAANTEYYLLLADLSQVTSNTSRSYINAGSIVFPEYQGAAVCGLYIKSAGIWVAAFEKT